jgi:hypothetical protein
MELLNNVDKNIIGTTELDCSNNNSLSLDPHYIGTSYSRIDPIQNTSSNLDDNEEKFERIDDNSVNIYRYKFTTEFTEELFKFSKIHQYDHRKDFKEAWERWVEDNTELIEVEVSRLNRLGYDGDIIDKMYKSARYYFRKKSTEKKEPVKRRIYVGSQKDLLEQMDHHITSNIKTDDFKPSDGFDDFCNKNKELLKEQVTMLFRLGITDSNEIKAKIKKTYKNRYFLIVSK